MWATVAALAVWATAAGTANAQRRGGGGHGGVVYHGGGGGVYHGGSGGYHNGYGGGYGGYHNGGYGGYGYYPHSGFSIGIFSGGYGYGGSGYGGYGYGGYGGSGYYPSSYGYSTYYPSTVYSNDYVPNVYVPSDATTTQSGYYVPSTAPSTAPSAAPTDNRARIHVRLPADAALWVDGDATQQTGAERDFTTPPLDPTSTYTYTLKARWMQGNEPVERTMKVDVRANQTTPADFSVR